MDNQQDTLIEDAQNVTAELPFLAFFSLLKNNGFSVTTQQIIDANKIIINYANRLKNEEELCLYLLPIFTGNEDEQLLFRKLFLDHFILPAKNTEPPKTIKEILESHIKKNWKKIITSYGILALLVITFVIFIFKEIKRPSPSRINVILVNPGMDNKKGLAATSFSITLNRPLELNTVCLYENRKDPFKLTSNTLFDWGDASPVNDSNAHIYKKQGKYDLIAFVQVKYKGQTIKTDTLRRLVLVCNEKNTLKIDYGGKTNVSINQSIVLRARVDNTNQPDYIKWSAEGRDLLYGNTYTSLFATPGTYSISCIAVYDSINSPCTIKQDITFTVVNPRQFKTDPPDSSKKLPDPDNSAIKKPTSPFLFYLYLSLAIVFGLFTFLFFVLSETERIKTGRLKKNVLEKYTKLIASFKGKKTPGVIPFRNKNYIPVHQSEINYAARQMRKRVNDNSKLLHIGKTIKKSIVNNGLFQPVLLPRTRQTEYLVLIDENDRNSQLVKLFEYLALEFKKQNILIEKYFYRSEPKLCYRLNEPGTITLEKLFTRHENHILLIFGDAYQLVYKFYPVFDSEYLALLNRWQHKAILTPVSFADWGTKEKSILIPHVPVFPLDVEGILLMSEYLSRDEQKNDIISRLNQHKSLFYKVEEFDLEDIDDLKSYCGQAKWAVKKENAKPVNLLFQWIAALAVYPKISWEVTIAIGKSILDKYNCINELNFTSLLRIARISWMKEGRFPDTLRFELLKELSAENELLARKTMLMLFEEIPAGEVKENSLAHEEKEIQQIINEFSLYANDPVYYSKYKQSKDIFEKLWDEKKLTDLPAKIYLKNPGNSWKTMINAESRDNKIINVGIEEYFQSNEKQETTLSKFYLCLGIISLIVLISSLFALRILYQWEHFTDV